MGTCSAEIWIQADTAEGLDSALKLLRKFFHTLTEFQPFYRENQWRVACSYSLWDLYLREGIH